MEKMICLDNFPGRWFNTFLPILRTEKVKHHEKDLPTQQYQEGANARFQATHENEGRDQRPEAQKGQGAEALDRLGPLDPAVYGSGMGDFSLSKNERLLSRPDFVNVNQLGKRQQSRHFIVKVVRNGLEYTRLGVTASKRTGSAVQRNRAKRLMREFFRLHKARFPQGYDVVIIAKKEASSLTLSKVDEELEELFFSKELFV